MLSTVRDGGRNLDTITSYSYVCAASLACPTYLQIEKKKTKKKNKNKKPSHSINATYLRRRSLIGKMGKKITK